MQHLDVEGVHDVVVHVQPRIGHLFGQGRIAMDARDGGAVDLALLERLHAIVARQDRQLLRRAHIGPDHAVALLHRIPGLPRRIAVQPAARLARLVQAGPVHRKLPAVVAAADAVRLDVAIEQAGAPVHAAGIEQPRPAGAVAEGQEVLAQDPHIPGAGSEQVRRQHRLPEPAHIFPARRARPDAGQELVGMLGGAAVGGAFGPAGGGGSVIHGEISLICFGFAGLRPARASAGSDGRSCPKALSLAHGPDPGSRPPDRRPPSPS